MTVAVLIAAAGVCWGAACEFIEAPEDFAGYTLAHARYDRAAGGVVVDAAVGGAAPGGALRGVIESPVITTKVPFDQAVASWNAFTPAGAYLLCYVQARIGSVWTKWYKMGLWSTDCPIYPRTTYRRQGDDQGTVDCETLKLKAKADAFRVRIQLESTDGKTFPTLRYLSVVVNDSSIIKEEIEPVKSVWGKELDVPYMSQLSVPGGDVWCSATSTTMLLRYWGAKLHRPELADQDITDAAHAIHDAGFGGTGNWSFNTAFAGERPGIRAFVTRFASVSQIEEWIAKGVPVIVSVDYSKLVHRQGKRSGHLMVIRGFTQDGKPVFNDPGSSPNSPRLRKVFTREDLEGAWLGEAGSWGTVYIIYPENFELQRLKCVQE